MPITTATENAMNGIRNQNTTRPYDYPQYIARMEQEFKENSERYLKGQAYLDKLHNEENQPLEGVTCDSVPTAYSNVRSFERELLQEQMYSMSNYLKVLGSRIMFAKAKEGLL
jgi:hypothetical protein